VRLLLARDLFQVVFFSSVRLLLARDLFHIVLLVQLFLTVHTFMSVSLVVTVEPCVCKSEW
jgi:hypothetical protein